jgi:hypothetical protein
MDEIQVDLAEIQLDATAKLAQEAEERHESDVSWRVDEGGTGWQRRASAIS